MKLVHNRTLEALRLHHDLMWVDEHSWQRAVAKKNYSLTGALLIETATRQKGRPLTLQAPDAEMAWHTREVVDRLYAWCDEAGQTFTLTLDDGRVFNVVFRQDESNPIEAKPVRQIATYAPDDVWHVSLKLMEV